MSKRCVTQEECKRTREFIVEKINGVEKRANLLLGTTTVTIILLAVELITRIH